MNKQKDRLFQGHAGSIAPMLLTTAKQQPGENAESGYFEINHRQMNYMKLHKHGCVIAGGMIESDDKQFKSRFNEAGMHLSRDGAECFLPVRATILDKQFGRLWSSTSNSPHN